MDADPELAEKVEAEADATDRRRMQDVGPPQTSEDARRSPVQFVEANKVGFTF